MKTKIDDTLRFLIGLSVSLFVVNVLFSWTTTRPVYTYDDRPETATEEILIPRSQHEEEKRLPPPTPPAITFSEVVEEITFVEEIFELSPDEFVDENTIIDIPVSTTTETTEKAPMAIPLPPSESENKIVVMAENMPVFGDCFSMENEAERRNCTNKSLMKFLMSRVKYPDAANGVGLEGTVVARFVINREGKVEKTEIIRDIGAGCGEEVLRAINELPRWRPGRQNGRPVSVMYTIPVKFTIN